MHVGVGKRSWFARGFAVAAVALTTGARAPGGIAWRPLSVGARSVFDVQLEEQADADVRKRRVRRVASVVETVAARGGASGAERTWFEVRTERRSPDIGGERRRGAAAWLSAEGAALREMARARAEDDTPMRHAAPLLWIPAHVEPGSAWGVGTLALAEGDLTLAGAAAAGGAVETPAGRFEDCLLLRYEGAYAAAPRSGGAGEARLAGGRFESREWLARGVGTVRAEIVRELRIEADPGSVRTRRVREVRTLRSRGEAP